MPASGLSAENVSEREPGGSLSSWYDGPTLLEAIDSFTPAPKATDKPFRMCVADVTSTGRVSPIGSGRVGSENVDWVGSGRVELDRVGSGRKNVGWVGLGRVGSVNRVSPVQSGPVQSTERRF